MLQRRKEFPELAPFSRCIAVSCR